MIKAKSLKRDRVQQDARSSSLEASLIFVSRFPAIALQNHYDKVYYRLSHDVVTWDVDRDVSTAYC